MLDTNRIKERLIGTAKVSREAIAAAEAHARASGQPLTQVLVASQIVSQEALGQCCADVSGLPYVTLSDTEASRDAARLLSRPCAVAWNVFPVSYAVSEQRLTLAVADPGAIPSIEALYRFFMQPYSISFTIASDAEIRDALQTYPGAGAGTRGPTAERQPSILKSRGKVSGRRPHMGSKEMAERLSRIGAGAEPRGSEITVDLDCEQIARALLNAAALIVRSRLSDDIETLAEVTSCVRYCQLLSTRLYLPTPQRDALLMAAWLFRMPDRREIVRQIASPYNLDDVFSGPSAPESRRRAEAWILSLVRSYQDLRQDAPEICKDITLTRRELRMRWSAAPERQDMLETFLQVLVDEEFLIRADKAVGRALIVDTAEAQSFTLPSALIDMGLEASAASSLESAEKKIADAPPDLILVNMQGAATAELRFCAELKNGADTAPIPVIALIDPDAPKLAVECLRAGIDDFVSKPLDCELLFLKIQRYLAPTGGAQAASGVSGPLDEMDFTDMIQILSAGRKNVEIVLTGKSGLGAVYMQNGSIIHACSDNLAGEEAFYELMRWREGEFTTHRCVDFPAATIESSTISLLMEGARRADESAGAQGK